MTCAQSLPLQSGQSSRETENGQFYEGREDTQPALSPRSTAAQPNWVLSRRGREEKLPGRKWPRDRRSAGGKATSQGERDREGHSVPERAALASPTGQRNRGMRKGKRGDRETAAVVAATGDGSLG